MERKMIIFSLMLIAMFCITSVCSRYGHGHSSHGHSSHGHSSHGHSSYSHASHGDSSSGHASHSDSSFGHASHGDSSGGHESLGHAGQGVSSLGQASHGDASYGSHHIDGDSNSHVESAGQNHHISESKPEGSDHYNPDSKVGSDDNSNLHGHDDSSYGYHRGNSYIHHHHHQAHHLAHQQSTPTTITTTTAPPPKIEETWLDHSCDQGLSNLMGDNYPRKKIISAVRKMNKILSSTSNLNKRHTIKREVRDYLFMLNMPNHEEAIDRSTGCDEVTSLTAPLGGCDVRSTGFIIVNVPDLTQVIKVSDCRSTFHFCDYSDGSMCLQSKRQQTLLVLPAKQGPFHLSDFRVATFKIHNGCVCLSGDKPNIFEYFF